MSGEKRNPAANLHFIGDARMLVWGGPHDPQSSKCSMMNCRAEIPEDAVPLRMWAVDGSAIVLCDSCVDKYVTVTVKGAADGPKAT